MSKYAVLITAATASAEWYKLDAPNRQQALRQAQRLAETDFAGDDDVVVVVDGITRAKKCNIYNARDSWCMWIAHLRLCKDFGEEFRAAVRVESRLKDIQFALFFNK